MLADAWSGWFWRTKEIKIFSILADFSKEPQKYSIGYTFSPCRATKNRGTSSILSSACQLPLKFEGKLRRNPHLNRSVSNFPAPSQPPSKRKFSTPARNTDANVNSHFPCFNLIQWNRRKALTHFAIHPENSEKEKWTSSRPGNIFRGEDYFKCTLPVGRSLG